MFFTPYICFNCIYNEKAPSLQILKLGTGKLDDWIFATPTCKLNSLFVRAEKHCELFSGLL